MQIPALSTAAPATPMQHVSPTTVAGAMPTSLMLVGIMLRISALLVSEKEEKRERGREGEREGGEEE